MSDLGAHRAFALRATVASAALLGLLLLLPKTGAGDEIEWMYDPNAVVEIHLGGLSEEELDALEAEPDEYQKGTFELLVGGVPKGPALTDVGIRLKGGVGSARPVKTGKSGFKVRFDEFVKGQLFFGIKRLTLNNMIQDPSMVHETLTYELFRSLSLPASRTGYAFVTLNGSDYGLFLNLETLDKISLPHWFETTQHLYEADAAGTDVTTGSATKFEVDEGDDEDIADLEALIEAVNDEEGDWSDNVSPFADLDQMTRAWAVERYVAHWDGYAGILAPFRPNNYYLHSDELGVFQTMPWGTDQTWEIDDLEFDEAAGGVMFNKCIADASCRQLYLGGLSEVRCAALESDDAARAAQLAAMLAPYQDDEDEARRETSPQEIAEELEAVEAFATVRPERLEDFLVAEGVLGSGHHPCGKPEPENPSGPVAISGQTPRPATTARFRRSQVKGAFVLTPIDVTGSARLTQRVSARVNGKSRRVCSDRGERAAAGRLVLRCRLPRWALDRLADGPLKLAVRIGFVPDFGASRLALRRLTAPRR
jgi:CotH kinase protein